MKPPRSPERAAAAGHGPRCWRGKPSPTAERGPGTEGVTGRDAARCPAPLWPPFDRPLTRARPAQLPGSAGALGGRWGDGGGPRAAGRVVAQGRGAPRACAAAGGAPCPWAAGDSLPSIGLEPAPAQPALSRRPAGPLPPLRPRAAPRAAARSSGPASARSRARSPTWRGRAAAAVRSAGHAVPRGGIGPGGRACPVAPSPGGPSR